MSTLSLIPHCALIENHDFYLREFVKNQRTSGGKTQVSTLLRIQSQTFITEYLGGSLSTVDLLIKVARFVKSE